MRSDFPLGMFLIWLVFTAIWLGSIAMSIGDQGGLTWRAAAAATIPFVIALAWWGARRLRR
jgi:hypothetical protein